MNLPPGVSAEQPMTNPLFDWLESVKDTFVSGNFPTSCEGVFGRHGIVYGADDEGIYAIIGMTLPDDVYAEVDDGTYGELNGFRIYLTDGPSNLDADLENGYCVALMADRIAVVDSSGDEAESVYPHDEPKRYSEFVAAIIEANSNKVNLL